MFKGRRSAIGLVYLRSPCGSTFMFCYYLLGCDTAAPSGLHAIFCQAVLVFNDHSENHYLRISTEPIFAIFSPNESFLGADDRFGPCDVLALG